MSIGLEIEKETETEMTEEIRLEPSVIGNRTRLLLSKRDTPDHRAENIERMMAEFDPNGS
jgi:hypothetical protein